MLIDQTIVFSDEQALRATGASTHTLDLTAKANAPLGRLVLLAHADTAFSGATQIVAALQTSSKADFSSDVSTLASVTLTADQLADTEKNLFAFGIPQGAKRYLRMYYTVTGTVSAGALTCFVADVAEMH